MRDGFALVNVAFALRVIQPAVIIRMPIKTGGEGREERGLGGAIRYAPVHE